MADKTRTHHIILVFSSRKGIISVAIGGSGSGGTDFVTIHIIVGVAFGCSIRLASGGGTVIIRLGRMVILRRMMIVAFEINIDIVFGIEIAVVVVNGKGPTFNPVVRIIIVGDKAKGPIIGGGRGLDIAVGTVIVMH